MLAAVFVLILFAGETGIATAEFKDRAACEAARVAYKELVPFGYAGRSACVPTRTE